MGKRIIDQYRIITSGAGWHEQGRGFLRFEGPDARAFLHNLLTNDIEGLRPGRGRYGALLNANGRMVTDLLLLDHGDHLLGIVAPGMAEPLARRFDGLIFAEVVSVLDVSEHYSEVLVTGSGAAALVASVSGIALDTLEALHEPDTIDAAGVLVMRDGVSPLPAYRLMVARPARAEVVARLEEGGGIELDEDLVTALRIEAGRAAWGTELTEDVIPLEAGLLERAISTTKGCYVGQEIVIRILHRGGGRVARRLVVLVFDESAERPAVGDLIQEGTGRERLTSVSWSPIRARYVALAYLPRDAAEIGRRVSLLGSGFEATVTALAQ
jgi:folate-binding protein YgfZ